jgi:hypothetical protein
MDQNPKQVALDDIDRQLALAGWAVQEKFKINLGCFASSK